MRLDQVLPLLGIVKRRTIAKRLADSGMILIDDLPAKPGRTVKVGDVIHIRGAHPQTVKILAIPAKSLSKTERQNYFQSLT